VIDLGKMGLPKRLIQPGKVRIFSHNIMNPGTETYYLKYRLTDCPFPAEFGAHEEAWDAATQTLNRPLYPGERTGIEVNLEIPPEVRSRPVVWAGALEILNRDSGRVLGRMPVKIINSRASSRSGGDHR